MSRTASDFPVGTSALFGTTLVRIHQHLDAETLLVFGPRLQRRVRAGELAPPPEKSLFDQWREERVINAQLGDVFTPATEVLADYRAWLERQGRDEDFPTSDYVFTGMMARAGHKVTRGLHRAAGDRTLRTRVLYALSLMPVLQ